MSAKKYDHLIRVIEKRNLHSYANFLLTPTFVQEIIIITNQGQKHLALEKLKMAEELLVKIKSDLNHDDFTWYQNLIDG